MGDKIRIMEIICGEWLIGKKNPVFHKILFKIFL